ncbi:hypothetical protein D0X99_04460 [Algoriphagus lacus]|uniref:Uncharacterized protein n=1 Tax=Algoriphagus lacus TaxID=2056311 RepID=A0A418PU22_9BACT|nr:hypothetical protein D0X99_04460 [Algoriphagus lacus]
MLILSIGLISQTVSGDLFWSKFPEGRLSYYKLLVSQNISQLSICPKAIWRNSIDFASKDFLIQFQS